MTFSEGTIVDYVRIWSDYFWPFYSILGLSNYHQNGITGPEDITGCHLIQFVLTISWVVNDLSSYEGTSIVIMQEVMTFSKTRMVWMMILRIKINWLNFRWRGFKVITIIIFYMMTMLTNQKNLHKKTKNAVWYQKGEPVVNHIPHCNLVEFFKKYI